LQYELKSMEDNPNPNR